MPNQDPTQNPLNTGTVSPVVPPTPNPVPDPITPTPPVSPVAPVSMDTPQIPVISMDSDIPPMPTPDFQNVAPEPVTTAPVSSSPSPFLGDQTTSQSNDGSQGSAAPSEMPEVTTTKKKFGGGKVIATILGLFLLVGGVGTGVFLTLQNQNIEEKAGASCGSHKSAGSCGGCSPSGFKCKWSSEKMECKTSGQACSTDSGGTYYDPDDLKTEASCKAAKYVWCSMCGGFCSASTTEGCNTAAFTKCKYVPTYGAKYSFTNADGSCPAGYTAQPCSCGGKGVCFDTAGVCDHTSSTGVKDGLCAVYEKTINASGGAQTYYCPGQFTDLEEGCNKKPDENFDPNCYCGIVQVDTPGEGLVSTPMRCGCPGDNNTSDSASCSNVKAYSSTWTLLTSAQLSALTAGTNINFCVAGAASSGSFDKARFTIGVNGAAGVLQPETTVKRPSSSDFCQAYTIPASGTSFNVTAQIHHTTLDWK